MGEKPKQELLRGKLGESLSENLARLQELYSSPVNGDVVTRPFECGEVRCALVYLQGMGVEKDLRKAAGYFSEAAERGEPQAMNNLGVMYLNGEGVQKDEKAAEELLRKSCAVVVFFIHIIHFL